MLALNEGRLAICLALIAGYVDACGLRAFGTYVSFMSGNTTQTGRMTGEGNLVAALPGALAIAFFVAGSFVGTWLAHSGLRQSRRVLFGVAATLLAATVSFMQRGAPDAKVGIVILSLAMGMMNNTLSRVGSEAVSLTFVTGDLNRVGNHLALAVKRAPARRAGTTGYPSSPGPAASERMGGLPGRRGAFRCRQLVLRGVDPAASYPDPAGAGSVQRCRSLILE